MQLHVSKGASWLLQLFIDTVYYGKHIFFKDNYSEHCHNYDSRLITCNSIFHIRPFLCDYLHVHVHVHVEQNFAIACDMIIAVFWIIAQPNIQDIDHTSHE